MHSWHPADIYALIRKRGGTLSSIAMQFGLECSTPRKALHEPCFAGETAVSEFLGIPAWELWPNRYDEDGLPLHPRARKALSIGQKRINPRQKSGAA